MMMCLLIFGMYVAVKSSLFENNLLYLRFVNVDNYG